VPGPANVEINEGASPLGNLKLYKLFGLSPTRRNVVYGIIVVFLKSFYFLEIHTEIFTNECHAIWDLFKN